MLTLKVHAYYRVAGTEQPDLPGLLVTNPPRRTARNRGEDVLALLLRLEGSAPITPDQIKELAQSLADSYYRCPGSVTYALRTAAAELNDRLMSRNIRTQREGTLVGRLAMAVLRGGQVYLAHSGPGCSYVVDRSGARAFNEQSAGRGLGLSKNPPVQFYQAVVQPGDVILLSGDPQLAWTVETLSGLSQLGPSHLRRRLLGASPADTGFALLKVAEGKGEIRITPLPPAAEEPEPAPAEAAPQTFEPAADIPAPETTPFEDYAPAVSEPDVEEWPAADEMPGSEPAAAPLDLPEETLPAVEFLQEEPPAPEPFEAAKIPPAPAPEPAEPAFTEPVSTPVRRVEPQPARSEARTWSRPAARPAAREVPPAPAPADETPKPPSESIFRRAGRRLARLWVRGEAVKRRTAMAGQQALTRMAQRPADEPPQLSTGTLLFIAVAVPLVIVAMAVTVYMRNGEGKQHQAMLVQASEYVRLAVDQDDPALRRTNWEQALQWIDQADQYGQSEESLALRIQAQAAIDLMDGVQRIDYQPASQQPFSQSVNIVKMTAGYDGDIYGLDSSTGRIVRLIFERPAYRVDEHFLCGPGAPGADMLIDGPLVDLAALPRDNGHSPATVMGIDQQGNILFCGPNMAPESITLIPPDAGWVNLADVTVASGTLYVLDNQLPAVWRYRGNGVDFVQAPRLYFDEQVPPLGDVVSLAVYGDDLFLLHADGHMTKCTSSEFDTVSTTCTEPFPYKLTRDGQNTEPVVSLGKPVSQVLATEYPAHSLFLFSPDEASIYYFSMVLNLQTELRPNHLGSYPVPERPATAFLITPDRRVLLAFGNEVMFGYLP